MIIKNLNSLEEIKLKLKPLKEEGYQVYPRDAIYQDKFGILATKEGEESLWLRWSVGTEEFLLIENTTYNINQIYSFFKRYEGYNLYRWDNPKQYQVGLMFLDWEHKVKVSLKTHMRTFANSQGWGPINNPKAFEILNWYQNKNEFLNDRLQELYEKL
jgi:hypothetical protein